MEFCRESQPEESKKYGTSLERQLFFFSQGNYFGSGPRVYHEAVLETKSEEVCGLG